jgi:uncharacterized protein
MDTLAPDDERALALVEAIRTGDPGRLGWLLEQNRGLAATWIRDRKGGARSTLHIATDWPGYFPNGPAVVRLLVDAGADPDATFGGEGETPLHWAASSDDVDVADALLDAGADRERTGGSIAGGTPLDNAVGYGCWNVARRLVERGAQEDIDNEFWQACACHGGQRRAAELLLARGADVNWVPDYARGTGLDVAAGPDTRRELLVAWLREHGARRAE